MKAVETLSHASVAVDKVQDLIEQQQHWCFRGSEHFSQCLSSRRCSPRGSAERIDALLTRYLAGQVDPGGLPPFCWVPSIADEDANTGGGNFCCPGLV